MLRARCSIPAAVFLLLASFPSFARADEETRRAKQVAAATGDELLAMVSGAKYPLASDAWRRLEREVYDIDVSAEQLCKVLTTAFWPRPRQNREAEMNAVPELATLARVRKVYDARPIFRQCILDPASLPGTGGGSLCGIEYPSRYLAVREVARAFAELSRGEEEIRDVTALLTAAISAYRAAREQKDVLEDRQSEAIVWGIVTARADTTDAGLRAVIDSFVASHEYHPSGLGGLDELGELIRRLQTRAALKGRWQTEARPQGIAAALEHLPRLYYLYKGGDPWVRMSGLLEDSVFAYLVDAWRAEPDLVKAAMATWVSATSEAKAEHSLEPREKQWLCDALLADFATGRGRNPR